MARHRSLPLDEIRAVEAYLAHFFTTGLLSPAAIAAGRGRFLRAIYEAWHMQLPGGRRRSNQLLFKWLSQEYGGSFPSQQHYMMGRYVYRSDEARTLLTVFLTKWTRENSPFGCYSAEKAREMACRLADYLLGRAGKLRMSKEVEAVYWLNAERFAGRWDELMCALTHQTEIHLPVRDETGAYEKILPVIPVSVMRAKDIRTDVLTVKAVLSQLGRTNELEIYCELD